MTNEKIRAKEVRLIGKNNEQIGIISIEKALDYAKDAGLDLVEIASNSNPPVCRILDYGKFVYEKKKKNKENRKKQKHTQLKEIKIRPKISEHDLEHKKKHLIAFLNEGNKVKVTMMFRGREMMYAERGIELMKSLFESLQDIAVVDREIKQEGYNAIMILSPKK